MSRRLEPKELPCITTSRELKPIVDGMIVSALAQLIKEPYDGPEDAQMLENEKLWAAGDKDGWLEAELARIKLGGK